MMEEREKKVHRHLGAMLLLRSRVRVVKIDISPARKFSNGNQAKQDTITQFEIGWPRNLLGAPCFSYFVFELEIFFFLCINNAWI